ncbi:MAG: hypothetical protein KatS3mg111_0639 [Pirellulaceae bacterium]|nr:MAG: hypothetical protein KatS3mg111_0639 [Pirellulaceae bacterium]
MTRAGRGTRPLVHHTKQRGEPACGWLALYAGEFQSTVRAAPRIGALCGVECRVGDGGFWGISVTNVRRLLGRVVVLAMLVGSAGCYRPSGRGQASPSHAPGTSPSATAGYVPDSACQPCHDEIYRRFQGHGMGRSFDLRPLQLAGEDFGSSHYYHEPSDRHYEMVREGNDWYQIRYQLDAQGRRVNEVKVRVDAVIGSGNHARTYLYRTPAGEWFQMPLGWFPDQGRWRLNPGYDRPDHMGFHRQINRECMFCHNAYPLDFPAGADAFWQPEVFPEQLPEGIGCQRCHGPGERHLELAETVGATDEQLRQSIVNPQRLPAELRDSVCNQCHLQPSAQISSVLVRAGRGDFSFRPGQALEDYRAMVDYRSEEDEQRFEINHHAYRLAESRCFQQSGTGMSCLSCHDPHGVVPESQRVRYYRERCLQCHRVTQCATAATIEHDSSNLGTAVADCVACHMPTRRAHDAIHAIMTDHRIVRLADEEEERLAARQEPPPVDPAVPLLPYRWRQSREDVPRLLHEQERMYLAIVASRLGNAAAVRELVEYTANRRDELLPMVELVEAFRRAGDVDREVTVLRTIVDYHPDHPQANLQLAMALTEVEAWEEARYYYQRSIELGPVLPEAVMGLGVLALRTGDMAEAEQRFRAAIALRPLYGDAHLNLGILLFSQRRWDEARQALRRAMAIDPRLDTAADYLQQMAAEESL